MDYKKLFNNLMGGGKLEDENEELRQMIEQLKKQNEEKEKIIQDKDKYIQKIEVELDKPMKGTKDITDYNEKNLRLFLKSLSDNDKILTNPEIYEFTEGETAFEKNIKANPTYFRKYQEDFIKDWSISTQELVILYYGVGSGKTTIAVNCGEQFLELNNNATVYFVVPASLVFNTIKEMYMRGINPNRKNEKGEYVYYFVSYQQLMRSKFDFKDNSLLILDEAHNLRNVKTKDKKTKISARKYESSGMFSLIGNKLATLLIENSGKFIRSIFMTGTLFVNGPEDIDSIVAIGYKKEPFLNQDFQKWNNLINDEKAFKHYFEGLISFYRISPDNPAFPKVKYNFVGIPRTSKAISYSAGEDAYYTNSRRDTIDDKLQWILQFLEKNRLKKNLIYSQFLESNILMFEKRILEMKIPNVYVISGQQSKQEKLRIVNEFNDKKIGTLLFTLAIKEGISFSEVNNIIISEPYWNYSILEQVIARGIRLTSHKLGNKSLVNVYFPIVYQEQTKNGSLKFLTYAEKAFNSGIKDFKALTLKEGQSTMLQEFGNVDTSSRDILMLEKILKKQSNINEFEKKLLKLPKFEEVNNNENNPFIKFYNAYVLELENEQKRQLSNREMLKLKRDLYKEFYQKAIKEKDKLLSRLRISDNPAYLKASEDNDPSKLSDKSRFEDKTSELRELIENDRPLDEMLSLYGVNKVLITALQANFTPQHFCEYLVNKMDMEQDKRNDIKILEPTAGVGNFLPALIKLSNNFNFQIDCNEIYYPFFEIGKTIYEDLNNVYWYNLDFYNSYVSKYNYDYIIGNPPFNLKTKVYITNKRGDSQYQETTLYDMDFVASAYNMLNDGGKLGMIISSKITWQRTGIFKNYAEILDEMEKQEPGSVKIIDVNEEEELKKGFKQSKGVSKEMATNWPMVMIFLTKIKNHKIDARKFMLNKFQKIELSDETLEKRAKDKEKRTAKKTKKDSKLDEKVNVDDFIIFDDVPEPEPEPKFKRRVIRDEPIKEEPKPEPKKLSEREKLEKVIDDIEEKIEKTIKKRNPIYERRKEAENEYEKYEKIIKSSRKIKKENKQDMISAEYKRYQDVLDETRDEFKRLGDELEKLRGDKKDAEDDLSDYDKKLFSGTKKKKINLSDLF